MLRNFKLFSEKVLKNLAPVSSCRSAQEKSPLISFADGCTSKNPSKEKKTQSYKS